MKKFIDKNTYGFGNVSYRTESTSILYGINGLYHGFFYNWSFYKKNFWRKGYYNMGIRNSHWLDYHSEYNNYYFIYYL